MMIASSYSANWSGLPAGGQALDFDPVGRVGHPHMEGRIAHAEVGQARHTDKIVDAQVIDLAAVNALQDGQAGGGGEHIEDADLVVRSVGALGDLGGLARRQARNAQGEPHSSTNCAQCVSFHNIPSFGPPSSHARAQAVNFVKLRVARVSDKGWVSPLSTCHWPLW